MILDDVQVREPYKVLSEPWNNELVLMDDKEFDKLQLLSDAKLGFVDEGRVLFTNQLPDNSKAVIIVDGYGHRLDVTVKALTPGIRNSLEQDK